MSLVDLPEVPRRVMRQLIESLVYEGAISSCGVAGDGVAYCWTERRRFSFDRVRVGPDPVVRIRPGEALQEAVSPRLFLEEIGPALAADPQRRTSFATELLQTVVNDTAARQHWILAGRAGVHSRRRRTTTTSSPSSSTATATTRPTNRGLGSTPWTTPSTAPSSPG